MPEARLINMISEATPLREESGFVHAARGPKPEKSATRAPCLLANPQLPGTGPIRGIFNAPSGLAPSQVSVWETTAYDQSGNSLGPIPGTAMCRAASSGSQMVIDSDGTANLLGSYTGNPAVFQPIANGVLPPVHDVAYLAGRFVYPASGTNRFYYSEINDAGNELGLDFASNETLADVTKGVAVLNDELVFFGSQHAEFWNTSTDITAPFAPIEGRGYERGCAARNAIAYADNALFWVGDNRVVYRSGNTPDRISSNAIEDKLRQCGQITACTALVATFEGHEFYVLNAPGIGTYAYDISRIGTTVSTYGDSYACGEWDEW